MARHLIKRGHEVSFFSLRMGSWVEHFSEIGQVHHHFKDNYDLILCNHKTCQEQFKARSCPMIRTCHGPEVSEEQPLPGADYYVSVSDEVRDHLKEKGFVSEVIRNGIDPEVFKPTREVKEIKKVLYMTDFEENAEPIRKACEKLELELNVIGAKNPVWNPVKEMDEADLIISLGRGAYEGLMMNRPVLIYDGIGDGWLVPSTWENYVYRNCSGRTNRITWDADQFEGILEDFEPKGHRDFAIANHNVNEKCDEYLRIAKDLGAKC